MSCLRSEIFGFWSKAHVVSSCLSFMVDVGFENHHQEEVWIPCHNLGSIFLASGTSGHHLDTQTFKNHPSGHPFLWKFLQMSISNSIIPMTSYKHIMPYFNKEMYVYGYNLSILWSPMKNRTLFWLRPCIEVELSTVFICKKKVQTYGSFEWFKLMSYIIGNLEATNVASSGAFVEYWSLPSSA